MRNHGSRVMSAIRGFGLGMLAMYLLDPDVGRRRRALVVDQFASTRNRLTHFADTAYRDAVNRSYGVAARLRPGTGRLQPMTAHQVEERVRARIGRVVRNSHALRVQARDDGTVVLSGPVLASEVNRLMSAVWSVRGVTGIEDQLQVHEQPGNVSALQGALAHEGRRGAGMAESWPPSIRLLAGVAGGALALAGLSRNRPLGMLQALLGGALVTRALANRKLGEVTGMAGPRSVHIDKEMFIAAPPERVFDFWQHQENFPQFMRNVEEVRPTGEDCWHWKVAGPFGPVEWDARITERELNRRLAWHTVEGAPVESEGRVDFEPAGEGTRLRVSMDYAPAAGAIGHAAARLLGRDAKTEMDEDLMRVKSFLETGVAARDSAARRAAEDAQRLH
uniref:BON domain-containing protein n=2 Tax=Aromatoleum anaerobium TaxID=182180 RepID=A0ABX1PLE5_9RHOO